MEGVTVEQLYMVIGVKTIEVATMKTQLDALRDAHAKLANELQAARDEIAELKKQADTGA